MKFGKHVQCEKRNFCHIQFLNFGLYRTYGEPVDYLLSIYKWSYRLLLTIDGRVNTQYQTAQQKTFGNQDYGIWPRHGLKSPTMQGSSTMFLLSGR
jgi:hypothetical protein